MNLIGIHHQNVFTSIKYFCAHSLKPFHILVGKTFTTFHAGCYNVTLKKRIIAHKKRIAANNTN